MGGLSDGWCYETSFAGASLQDSFDMIRRFLEEEGYDDVPLPADAEELLLFKTPIRNRQIVLFEDSGYVHNPIKILFPRTTRLKHQLILQLYNEQAPGHLVRFHRVDVRRKSS